MVLLQAHSAQQVHALGLLGATLGQQVIQTGASFFLFKWKKFLSYFRGLIQGNLYLLGVTRMSQGKPVCQLLKEHGNGFNLFSSQPAKLKFWKSW